MCELLGISSARAVHIQPELTTFFRHSTAHPHGWGLFYQKETTPVILRGAERAIDNPSLFAHIRTLPPQTAALAHIRYATVGRVRMENCHPFSGQDCTGRRWTLIHNGTIQSGGCLLPYRRIQTGDTDSERVFLYILDRINQASRQHGGFLPPRERFHVLEGAVRRLSPRNKLNLLLYDEEFLYVHKNMPGTLYCLQEKDTAYFATTPLDDRHWTEVVLTTLLAYQKGQLVRTGTAHGHIYYEPMHILQPHAAMYI